MRRWLVVLMLVLSCAACRRSAPAPAPAPEHVEKKVDTPRVTVSDDHYIGEPKAFGNLSVFPILAKTQWDIGAFTTLDRALEAKTALVRERGPRDEGGPSVGRLMIENKGEVPILVLAGTVVKGGNQDRQIGQDFVIEPKKTIPVDAYCVEHGRWNDQRNGVSTNGQFGTLKVLANGEVRGAGQYRNDQSEVWNRVGKVNAAHKTQTHSDTLTASLDDAEIAKRRGQMAESIEAFLRSHDAKAVVGMAYAIDGKVKGARWFVNHQLFELYKSTLVQTAAQDALTAQKDGAPTFTPPTAQMVKDFVAQVDAARAEEKPTPAANVNEYRDSQSGWGSSTKMSVKARPMATGSAPAPPPVTSSMVISKDYLSK